MKNQPQMNADKRGCIAINLRLSAVLFLIDITVIFKHDDRTFQAIKLYKTIVYFKMDLQIIFSGIPLSLFQLQIPPSQVPYPHQ